MLQPKLIKVEPIDSLKLRLYYETGEVKLFDVTPYATGSWYGQLKDENYFRTVQMLPGGIGIEWPEGQDIAPHELYENSVIVRKLHKSLIFSRRAYEKSQALFLLLKTRKNLLVLWDKARNKGERIMNESIFNKIWNYTISVGQIITTFLIGCAVALVMWLFVQIFWPSKD